MFCWYLYNKSAKFNFLYIWNNTKGKKMNFYIQKFHIVNFTLTKNNETVKYFLRNISLIVLTEKDLCIFLHLMSYFFQIQIVKFLYSVLKFNQTAYYLKKYFKLFYGYSRLKVNQDYLWKKLFFIHDQLELF